MNDARPRNLAFEQNGAQIESSQIDKTSSSGNLCSVQNIQLKIVNPNVSEPSPISNKINYQTNKVNNSTPIDSQPGVNTKVQNTLFTGTKNMMDLSTQYHPFRELDEAFSILWCKMKANGLQRIIENDCEKLKFSRAINLIYKNNLSEIHVRDIKMLVNNRDNFDKYGETSSSIILNKFEKAETITSSHDGYLSLGNSHKTYEISNSNNLIISPSISNNFNKATNTSPSSILSVDSVNKINPNNSMNSFNLVKDLKTNSSTPLLKNISKTYAGKDNNKFLNHKRFLTPLTENELQTTTLPINNFSSAIGNPNNFHVNMNITNININQKNHPLLKEIEPHLTCVQDLKLISELKDCLRINSVRFTEEHSSTFYVLKFKIPLGSYFKQYFITIDLKTFKIKNYEKFKGDEKVIVINNTEGKKHIIYKFVLESDANLIFNDISCLRKELEKKS